MSSILVVVERVFHGGFKSKMEAIKTLRCGANWDNRQWWCNGSTVSKEASGVIGKLLIDGMITKEVLRSTLIRVWRVNGKTQFEEIVPNTFIIYFMSTVEKNQVFSRRPWLSFIIISWLWNLLMVAFSQLTFLVITKNFGSNSLTFPWRAAR